VSIENLKEYTRRCAADPELLEKAKAIGDRNIDGQIAHAVSLGLPWTQADLIDLSKELQTEGELSDEDLEQVAGGRLYYELNVTPGGIDFKLRV